ILQNSGAVAYFAFRAYLINSKIVTEFGEIEAATVGMLFNRSVRGGIHEDFDIHNYGCKRARFNLELALRTDFADIFEVKSKRIVRKGNVTTQWSPETFELLTTYQHGGFNRSLRFRVSSTDSQPVHANGRIILLIDLAPGAVWHACCEHEFIEPARTWHSPSNCGHQAGQSDNAAELRDWRRATTSITTANEDIYRLFKQSVEDMAALRLPPQDGQQREFVPAAGVPWFVTVFGRDRLIVSLQNLIVYPDFARGALEVLGQLQATEIDNFR